MLWLLVDGSLFYEESFADFIMISSGENSKIAEGRWLHVERIL